MGRPARRAYSQDCARDAKERNCRVLGDAEVVDRWSVAPRRVGERENAKSVRKIREGQGTSRKWVGSEAKGVT